MYVFKVDKVVNSDRTIQDCSSNSGLNHIKLNEAKAKIVKSKRKLSDDCDILSYGRPIHQKPRTCDICQKTFQKPYYLVQHKQSVHFIDVDYHACDICNKVFRLKNALHNHKRLMHLHPDKKYSCEICLKKFKTSTNLNIHRNCCHQEESAKCDLCDKPFKSDVYLARHMKTVHSNKEPLVCEICGNSYKALSYHMKMFHEAARATCEICNKTYINKRFLERHKNYVHLTVEKNFICDICGVQFKDKRGLLQHSVVHTNKRDFKCNICEKAFKHKVTLKTHQRVHNDVTPYNCKKCGESFKWKQTFNNHSSKCSGTESAVNI